MKKLLTLCFVIASFSSQAHGLKRLTTTNCSSDDSKSTILVKYDSSITPIGPVEVEINGEQVRPVMEFGSDYLGLSGQLSNDEKFNAIIFADNTYEAKLKINDSERDLTCNTETKFRFF